MGLSKMNNVDVYTIEELFKEVEITTMQLQLLAHMPLELENALKTPSDLIKYCFYMAQHLLSISHTDPEITRDYSEKYFYTGLYLIERFQDSSIVPGEILEGSVFVRLDETRSMLGLNLNDISHYLFNSEELKGILPEAFTSTPALV